MFSEPRKIRKIATLHLEGEYFKDEANQTIGAPGVGPDAIEIFQNRRSVTSRLTDTGKALKQKLVEYFKQELGLDVKLVWSIHAGCSMCPCSPGFNVLVQNPEAITNKWAVYRRGRHGQYEYIWGRKEGGVDILDFHGDALKTFKTMVKVWPDEKATPNV